ncbi:unnamed protein product [Brassica napus]|uniref:(rape) hypothetical protein n=1 Tax=Brassica napus TaxID=3708 RepID=A0A816M4T3_BRANA|nr:unnamed protein product [Brassica napus]
MPPELLPWMPRLTTFYKSGSEGIEEMVMNQCWTLGTFKLLLLHPYGINCVTLLNKWMIFFFITVHQNKRGKETHKFE